MNPDRHSFFYDKATGTPVVNAEEVIQVGDLVLAKKVTTASRKDPRFNIDPKDPDSVPFVSGGKVLNTLRRARN